jgi:hypothetical protein
MKSLIYIFAIIFSVGTISNSFATDKGKDKNNATTSVMRTEIATLIEETATSEVNRNLVLDSLEIASDFITNLIETDAANEVDTKLDVYETLQLSALENLAETNANLELDTQLNDTAMNTTININALQNLIDSNVLAETTKITKK